MREIILAAIIFFAAGLSVGLAAASDYCSPLVWSN